MSEIEFVFVALIVSMVVGVAFLCGYACGVLSERDKWTQLLFPR